MRTIREQPLVCVSHLRQSRRCLRVCTREGTSDGLVAGKPLGQLALHLGLRPSTSFHCTPSCQETSGKLEANGLALITCITLALLAVILRSYAGEPSARISPAWVFVFFVSRWIMIRPLRGSEPRPLSELTAEGRDHVKSEAMSREQMIEKLEAIVASPSTDEVYRTQARSRLEAFRKRCGRTSPTAQTRIIRSSLYLPKIGRKQARATVYILLSVVAADAVLMISGFRLLVRERVVNAGDSFGGTEWAFENPVLECRYWTGRKALQEVYWHGSGKSQRDECPVMHKHQPGD